MDAEMIQEKIPDAKVEDYLVGGNEEYGYGIFKLTPRECGRLKGVADEDLDKMLEINSKTQVYKQIGNSISVPVLMMVYSQLNIKGVKTWNEATDDENYQRCCKGIHISED